MTWAALWHEALRQAGVTEDDLGAGAAYASNDDDLDVLVEPGRLEATAGLSRRVSFLVTIEAPPVPASEWEDTLDYWATHPALRRDLLDGRVAPTILEGPKPTENTAAGTGHPRGLLDLRLGWACSCGAKQPCRHVASVLVLFAELIDDQPLELLRFRGLAVENLRAELMARQAMSTAPLAMLDARRAWSATARPFPGLPARAAEPGSLSPFASAPPPSAPFSADGLLILGNDAARRAWRVLDGDAASAALGLDSAADLARRAAEVPGTPPLSEWADRAGITRPELEARVGAWQLAGPEGVEAQMDWVESLEISQLVRVRRTRHDQWFRFDKQRGRWRLTRGPAKDPDDLTRDQAASDNA